MSGVSVVIDDTEVLAAFNNLISSGNNLQPALNDIGEMLDASTDERFDRHEAPDDSQWAELREVTIALKRRNKNKILTGGGSSAGRLRESLIYQSTSNSLIFGTNIKYAAAMQFGASARQFGGVAPWGDMPARPFLGISDDDKSEIIEILSDHINNFML